MKPVGRIETVELFEPERAALVSLLSSLSAAEWGAATVCDGWAVKDLAAHIVADNLGIVASRRDGHTAGWFEGEWAELVAYINRQNEQWVESMRRVSPRLIIELLEFAGERMEAQLWSLDMDAIGHAVSWVSDDPAPVWLDVAREYTERWAHQQQIRDAIDAVRGDGSASGLRDRRMFHPVLDAYVRALPLTFRGVAAADGTSVRLEIEGEAGGTWTLLRERGAWSLYEGAAGEASAAVAIDQDVAWRLFTKAITPPEARERVRLSGDAALAARVLEMVSVVA